MSQFGVIFIDSLRLLRARALFWITLGITLFAALLYLSIGFTDSGVSVLFGLMEIENPSLREGTAMAGMFYFAIFSMFLVNIWLSWIAVILALITSAPIFPEFMAEGAAGSVLCKPISRLRLFIYKYLSGLLFAFIQTSVFCLVVFVAMRWRVGSWNPTVFWAVPLIVLMFSYLWSVMVAVGVRTGSVMASVLSALLLWLGCWTAKAVEDFTWMAVETGELPFASGNERLEPEERALWGERRSLVEAPYVILPKTTDTVNLLQRFVRLEGDREFSLSEVTTAMIEGVPRRDETVEAALTRRSPGFILGTSLAFELVVFGVGAWMFCRKDF